VTIYQLLFKSEIHLSPVVNGVFVEHTSMKVENAMKIHKLVCQNRDHKSYDNLLYKKIRANGGWDNWFHLVLENCPSINKEQALTKKREWIKKISNAMNEVRLIPSYKEDTIHHNEMKDDMIAKKHRESHKDAIKGQREVNLKDDKDLIREKRKMKYEVNKTVLKEKSKEYRDGHKDKIKEQRKAYLEANKDIIREQQKAYYESNREIIIERTKLYQEVHKDELIEYRKAYKEVNRDRILGLRRVRYEINKQEINERRRESRRLKKSIE
jgi:hypothetical protein